MFGFVLSSIALIKMIGMEKSTHNITYMPVDPEIDKLNEEFSKEWATKDESLKAQQKAFKEDLEETMPEFLPDEEEMKIHSF